ncbi:helix-turn-helix domain-containing protein [Streptomyces sp. NRRL S-350]|uniref:helix-turn-helix domain-containing protein n=1 Tax=Streptomyces sp. NRRL S-350 TaxID=1463902 RepID=UPI0006920462|nr:helix-turn-helix transcriptional regulator [Streptomyces sp. NRRL S-350]
MDHARPLIEDFPAHPDGDPADTLARAVRARRTALGLTIADLSTRSGLPEAHLRTVEAGHAMPTLALLTVLSRALRVDR